MQKSRAAMLAVLIALISGCHYTSKRSDNKGTYILFVTPLVDHNLWLQAKRGFMDACELYQYHCD